MNEIIAIGIIISLIFSEITALSPGGIIVPAYFSLYLHDYKRIIFKLVISFLCYFIVKQLSNVMILYGKRRFTMYVLVGIFLKAAFSFFYYEGLFSFTDLSVSIGYLIPGLLAKDMDRQGIAKTLVSLTIVTLIIYMVQHLLPFV